MESVTAEKKLFRFLDQLNIQTRTLRHAPVFTVDEAKAVRIAFVDQMNGGHGKTLFVRDKKKRYALVMVAENRRVDLKSLAGKLSLGRIFFASPDRLKETLGVVPGAVTPFALVNAQNPIDTAPGFLSPLTVAIDTALTAQKTIWFHPLHNEATTAIRPTDLLKFIKACGYTPLEVDLE